MGLNGHGYLNGYGSRNGSNGSLSESEPPQSQATSMGSQPQETGSTEPLDDPTCYVAGEAKGYSQITDEDHELMTPEEYTAYFEIFQARSES